MRSSLLPLLAVAVAFAPGCHESPAEVSPTPPTQSLGENTDTPRMMRGRDPVARILAQRQALELSGDQVGRLEAIQARLNEQNSPLITQLEDLRPEGARRSWMVRRERRGARAGRMRELAPEQREEIRERMQARRQELQDLTSEQREELRARREALRLEVETRRAQIRERMEELRPVFEQLGENNRQALQEARAVLTEEQRSLLESRREDIRREVRERRGEGRGRRFRMRFRPDEGDVRSEDRSR